MGKIIKHHFLGVLLLVILAGITGYALTVDLTIVPIALIATVLFLVLLSLSVQNPLAVALMLIFTLPYERIPSLQLGGATIRLSQILLSALVISLTLRVLTRHVTHLKLSPYFHLYLLFLLSLVTSFLNMQDTGRGLLVFVFLVFTSLAMWVVPAVVNTKDSLARSALMLFVAAVIVSIFGIYQFVGDIIGLPASLTGLRDIYTKAVFGFPRVQSTAYEPLYLANYLIIPLTLAVTYAVRSLPEFKWRLYVTVIGLGGLVFILTLSRGGYLGLIASLLIIGAVSIFKLLRPAVLAGGMIIGTVVMVGVVLLFRFSDLGQKSIELTQKHFTNVGQDASTLHRFSTFDQAMDAYVSSPVTGVGIGNFGPWVANFPNELPQHGWAIVNNEPLEIVAELGVIGAIALALLIGFLILRSLQAIITTRDQFLRATMIGLLAAFVGILVQYQFFSTLYIMHIWVLIGLMIATQNIISQQEKQSDG